MPLHHRPAHGCSLLLWVACATAARAAGSDAPGHPLLKACAPTTRACAERLEAQAIKAQATVARRAGPQLWLSTVAGQAPLQLSDQADGALVYRYLGRLPGTDLHLVAQIPQHGAPRYLPLGPGMAGTVRFNAPPWPSADGRWLAVAVAASGEQVGQLALWGRVGSHWRLQYNFDPDPGMGFEFRGWRADGAALRLGWHCPQHSGATQLRDGPYGWDLVPPPPAHCGR